MLPPGHQCPPEPSNLASIWLRITFRIYISVVVSVGSTGPTLLGLHSHSHTAVGSTRPILLLATLYGRCLPVAALPILPVYAVSIPPHCCTLVLTPADAHCCVLPPVCPTALSICPPVGLLLLLAHAQLHPLQSPLTQSRKLLTHISSFGAFAALVLAKAFAGNEFGQSPRGCGLNSGWATPLAISRFWDGNQTWNRPKSTSFLC